MNKMQSTGTSTHKAGAHCCLCKQSIDFEVDANNIAINAEGSDPCGIGFVTNVFGPRGDQREQWFYCHAECFRRIVNDDSIMYILEPDMSTIGECDEERLQETLDAASSTLEAL